MAKKRPRKRTKKPALRLPSVSFQGIEKGKLYLCFHKTIRWQILWYSPRGTWCDTDADPVINPDWITEIYELPKR